MGMYTGLRGVIVFKDEYRDGIAGLLAGEYDWSGVLPCDTDGQKEWVGMHRNEFIPNGAIAYLKSHGWKKQNEYDLKSGVLKFACELKNYGGEIGAFLDLLPEIAYAWELEERYEEETGDSITHRRN